MPTPRQAALLSGASLPVLALDFGNRLYQVGGAKTTDPSALPGWSFTRAGAGTAVRGDGTVASFGTGVPRITDLGYLAETSRTNSFRNSSMVGAVAGTPGTNPTNWSTTLITGVSQQIVGTGTDGGLPYIDYRFFGTPSTSGNISIVPESILQVAAVSGQTWTASAYLSLSGGSLTNIGFVLVEIGERTSGGSSLATTNTVYALASTRQRPSATRTLNQATTAFVDQILRFAVTSGNAVDFTVRVAATQMEQGSAATSWIPTTTVAVTRAVDNGSISVPPATQYLITGAAAFNSDGKTLAQMVDGSANGLRLYWSGGVLNGVTAIAGVENSPVAIGRLIAGQPANIAISLTPSAVNISYNSKPAVSLASPASYTTLYLAEKSDASAQWGGELLKFVASRKVQPAAISGLFDDFTRANGAIGTAITGQPWQQVPASAAVVAATISSNTLVAADSGLSSTAAYNGIDFGSTIHEMRALISYGSGTANGGAMGLITNPNGLSAISNITDSSVHIIFTDTKVDVDVWAAGVQTIIQSFTYSSVLAHDGTLYSIGWVLNGSTVTVYLPDGSVQSVTDGRLTTQGGRYGTFEHFWNSSGAARPTLYAAYAR